MKHANIELILGHLISFHDVGKGEYFVDIDKDNLFVKYDIDSSVCVYTLDGSWEIGETLNHCITRMPGMDSVYPVIGPKIIYSIK